MSRLGALACCLLLGALGACGEEQLSGEPRLPHIRFDLQTDGHVLATHVLETPGRTEERQFAQGRLNVGASAQRATLERLRDAVIPEVRPKELRDDMGLSRLVARVRVQAHVPWRYVQWVLALCTDNRIGLARIELQAWPLKKTVRIDLPRSTDPMPPVIEEGVEEPFSPDVLTFRVEPSQADGPRNPDTMVSVGDAPAVRYRLAGNVDELRKQLVAEQKKYRFIEVVGPKAGKGEVPALSVILFVELLQEVDFETIWLGAAPLPGG